MDDLEFIKNISSNINIAKICKKCKIDRSNLISGRTTKENIKIIRREIESEIAKCYIDQSLLKDNKK